MRPKISICLPNLNTRPFLDERFRTIFNQSFGDWELLVYDSYSNDGSWEYISKVVADEPRARAWQGPREGTPGSWSACIRQARGEYVYVATSDDTMAPDCLEKLHEALDARPECELAHCRLRAIDQRGAIREDLCDWWAEGAVFGASSSDLLQVPHVRLAPFDGLLHLLGETPYVSVTQLLIRRTLFDRVGLFESRWGSVGDFAWNMRAALVANTVHVPDTWGGWRCHPSQATAAALLGTDAHEAKLEAMMDDAIAAMTPMLPQSVVRGLPAWRAEARELREFERRLGDRRTPSREAFVLWRALTGSGAARTHTMSSLRRRPFTDLVTRWLDTAGLGPMLRVLPTPAGAPMIPTRELACRE
jgi:hypothetical protein